MDKRLAGQGIRGTNANDQNFKGYGNNQEEEKARREEYNNEILAQILDQDARTRLNTLKTAKPEKGVTVEQMLIQMARRGQITKQLDEEELKEILEQFSNKFTKKTTVKFDRRRACLDSDDENDV